MSIGVSAIALAALSVGCGTGEDGTVSSGQSSVDLPTTAVATVPEPTSVAESIFGEEVVDAGLIRMISFGCTDPLLPEYRMSELSASADPEIRGATAGVVVQLDLVAAGLVSDDDPDIFEVDALGGRIENALGPLDGPYRVVGFELDAFEVNFLLLVPGLPLDEAAVVDRIDLAIGDPASGASLCLD